MFRKSIYILTFIAALIFAGNASARIFIPVDQPADKKFPIAVADIVKLDGGSGSAAKKIAETIRNDLELSGYFTVIPKSAYIDRSKDVTADTIDFKKWTMIDARALVKGSIGEEEGRIVVQLKLFDPYDREMLVGKQYTFEDKYVRKIAHRFADEVMLSLTGLRGVFGTRIAYTKTTGKRSKAIFIMDMDGENETRITKDKSISLGANWSPDGTKLAYASYLKGFPDIFTIDLKTGHTRQLTSNRSTNIAPSWSPTGGLIAFSSSAGGNMEVYTMNTEGGDKKKITSGTGIDISPTFSPEGNEFAFASERGANVHIYKQSINGGNATRITFVGSHNDSPDWSPDGQKIAFSGRGGGTFDIYTVNADGSNVQRLTIASGTNEDPSWSPDSRFITFSSTREGQPRIFMMRYDGANQVRLNKKGDGMIPSWGPWEK